MSETARDGKKTNAEAPAAELITIPRAARELGVGVRQVRSAVARGELASYRVGGWRRIRRSDLSTWISAQRIRITPHARRRVEEVLNRERSPRK
jgi:excisionase family DNA binding protein